MKGLHLNVAIGVLAATASIAPVQAQSLLGGVLGGDGRGGLVSIDSGTAGDNSVVNLGLGGGGGNVLDANIGSGSQPLASANVSSGGPSGQALGIDANVGGSLANANVGVGGGQGVGVGLDVLDGTISTTATIGGGSNGNTGSNNGRNTDGVNDPIANNNPNTRGRILIGRLDAGSVSALPGCSGVSARQLQQLVNTTRVTSSWSTAANVEVRPVPLCPEQAAWLRNALRSRGVDQALQQAVISDALISASLSRTRYGADDVIAVNQSGGRLTVYVN